MRWGEQLFLDNPVHPHWQFGKVEKASCGRTRFAFHHYICRLPAETIGALLTDCPAARGLASIPFRITIIFPTVIITSSAQLFGRIRQELDGLVHI